MPAWKASISSVLASERATISSAVITHWHDDHVEGIPDLKSLCPDVKIYKYPHSTDDGEELPLEDGQELSVEGATVTAVHTPGHTTDHLCLLLKEEQALFTGDNVLGQVCFLTPTLPCKKGNPIVLCDRCNEQYLTQCF